MGEELRHAQEALNSITVAFVAGGFASASRFFLTQLPSLRKWVRTGL